MIPTQMSSWFNLFRSSAYPWADFDFLLTADPFRRAYLVDICITLLSRTAAPVFPVQTLGLTYDVAPGVESVLGVVAFSNPNVDVNMHLETPLPLIDLAGDNVSIIHQRVTGAAGLSYAINVTGFYVDSRYVSPLI